MLYTEVIKPSDAHMLQHDLNMLHKCSLDNGMRFNATKSNIIIFGNSASSIHFDYFLGGAPVTQSKSTKYLGVYLTSNLQWDMHAYRIYYTKSDESLRAHKVHTT